MRKLIGALALVTVACSGEKPATQAAADTAKAAPVAAAPAAPSGPVKEIKMELAGGKYQFSPSSLTIKVGDVVRFINVSGGPHNVAFFKDSMPAGAFDVINAAMKNQMAPNSMAANYMADSLATYDVSFANAPVGTYKFTCQPHAPMGMHGTIKVEK
jgi:plastocyanin